MASPMHTIVVTNELVTGPPGEELLRLASLSQETSVDVLDLACGGGIITSSLLDAAAKNGLRINQITAADIDDNMLDFVTKKRDAAIESDPESSWSLVRIEKTNQAAISLPAASFTHVFNNFGIFFCPDDNKALEETYRVLKPSGVAGFTSWKSIAWWAEVADPALAQYLPEAPKLPSPGGLFPTSGWSDPAAIPSKLEKAGFGDVRVSEFKFQPRVEAKAFAQATGFLVQSIARRVWSEDVFARFGGEIEGALLWYLEAHFEGGVWDGSMTAIISLGTRE